MVHTTLQREGICSCRWGQQAQSAANQGPQGGPDMGGGYGGGAPEQDPNPSPEGDVVDGDFKEI